MKNLKAALLLGSFLAALAGGCAHRTYGDPGLPVAGKALGTVIHTRDADELRYVMLRELTGRYARQQGIEVTAAETQAYVGHVQDALREDRDRQAARREEVRRRLAQTDLPATERGALAQELEMLDSFLAALGEVGAGAASPEEQRAREEVAAAFIRQWKINRALYREFGGRIVFQQGGPEPLDAYRRFLEAAQARGDFEILNKDLEKAFWGYYTNDSIHSFYRPGSAEEARAFDVAPWGSAAR